MPPHHRLHKWRFVWDQESTKRGALRVLTAGCALYAVKAGPEAAALVLAIGQLVIGVFGMFRTD